VAEGVYIGIRIARDQYVCKDAGAARPRSENARFGVEVPSPFATLATWQSHLRLLESLAKSAFLRAELIETAHQVIADKLHEAGRLH
jgi:hypothetical protein